MKNRHIGQIQHMPPGATALFFSASLPFPWTSSAKEASLAPLGEGPVMDDESRDLANRLFAAATMMLEDAVEVAAKGQSRRLTPLQLAKLGRRLEADLRDIAVLTEAARIVAGPAPDRRQKNPKRPV